MGVYSQHIEIIIRDRSTNFEIAIHNNVGQMVQIGHIYIFRVDFTKCVLGEKLVSAIDVVYPSETHKSTEEATERGEITASFLADIIELAHI